MKRLLLPLIGSKTLIQAYILPSFTCVMRCHTSSPKGKGRNLISSNSLLGAQLPACWLANPDVHRFLNPGQLTTPALPKRISVIFLWTEFFQRYHIPIFNPLLKKFVFFEGDGAHTLICLHQKITRKEIIFLIGVLSLC